MISSLRNDPGRFSWTLCGPNTPAAQKSRSRGVGSVEMVTGFSGARTSRMKVWNVPLAHFSAFASSTTTASLRPGNGSGVCVPPGNGGDQVTRDSSSGRAASLTSWMVNPPSRHAA